MSRHDILDAVDEIKSKLTDAEYKKIVDSIGKSTPSEDFYVISYLVPDNINVVNEEAKVGFHIVKNVIKLTEEEYRNNSAHITRYGYISTECFLGVSAGKKLEWIVEGDEDDEVRNLTLLFEYPCIRIEKFNNCCPHIH